MGFDVLLVLFALLVLFLLPFVIFFGLLGMAFQGFLGALLFILKYLLPGAGVGLLVTLMRSSRAAWRYEWDDYAKGAAIGLAAGFGLLLVWLRVVPVDLKPPALEEVTSITVSYGEGEDLVYGETTDLNKIEALYNDLFGAAYYRTIEELRHVDEDEGYPLNVELFDADGNSLGQYVIYNSKCMKKGLVWYMPKKDYYLNRSAASDVIWTANRERNQEKWMPFINELFDSVEYDGEAGELLFTIPRTIPDTTDDYYKITLNIIGMVGYEEGGEYQARSYQIYSAEQEESSWETNTTYSLPEINNALWETISISVNTNYLHEVYDCISLLPESLVKSK